MTLLDVLINRMRQSIECDSLGRGSHSSMHSPPPPLQQMRWVTRRRKHTFLYSHVKSKVDCSPPKLDVVSIWIRQRGFMATSVAKTKEHFRQNMAHVQAMRHIMLHGGKVDCHRKKTPNSTERLCRQRIDNLKRIYELNKIIYKNIVNAPCKVIPTKELHQDWEKNKKKMLRIARKEFVLFSPVPQELMEDKGFLAPPGVKRPRLYLTLGFRGGFALGTLCIELFSEMCPNTCELFTKLAMGDGVGYSYVGTHFYTKVPGMFWSGGDVICDNGFGCYAQKGHIRPIGAENYHFPHSMPGLVSMRVTVDDEVCGVFNITFKAMPSFDLQNVVIGRVVRPSATFEAMKELGAALRPRPLIEIFSSRVKYEGKWHQGTKNTRLLDLRPIAIPKNTKKYLGTSYVYSPVYLDQK